MVTKQQQLEWLAENHESWPYIGPVMIMSDKSIGVYYGAQMPGCHFVSFTEWQQERDKMQKQAAQPAQPARPAHPAQPAQPAPDNSWHERGELPPVGDVIEAWFDDGIECWHMADVVGYSKHESGVIAVSLIGKHGRKLVWVHHFRPLRTEREKAIDAACDVICKNGVHDFERGVITKLYDAGLLK